MVKKRSAGSVRQFTVNSNLGKGSGEMRRVCTADTLLPAITVEPAPEDETCDGDKKVMFMLGDKEPEREHAEACGESDTLLMEETDL